MGGAAWEDQPPPSPVRPSRGGQSPAVEGLKPVWMTLPDLRRWANAPCPAPVASCRVAFLGGPRGGLVPAPGGAGKAAVESPGYPGLLSPRSALGYPRRGVCCFCGWRAGFSAVLSSLCCCCCCLKAWKKDAWLLLFHPAHPQRPLVLGSNPTEQGGSGPGPGQPKTRPKRIPSA